MSVHLPRPHLPHPDADALGMAADLGSALLIMALFVLLLWEPLAGVLVTAAVGALVWIVRLAVSEEP